MKRIALAAGLALVAASAVAENFTTAAEVRPILEMQNDRWIAVREFDGRDLVYFTSVRRQSF